MRPGAELVGSLRLSLVGSKRRVLTGTRGDVAGHAVALVGDRNHSPLTPARRVFEGLDNASRETRAKELTVCPH